MLKRREFMSSAALASVGIPVAAGRLSIDGGKDGGLQSIPRPVPAVSPVEIASHTTQHKLQVLAREAVRLIAARSSPNITFLGWYAHLVQGGDTLHEHNTETRFDQHLVATTESHGLDLMELDDAQLLTTFAPPMLRLANLFAHNSRGKTVKMARLPMPITGCGAVAGSWSDGNASVRVVANYDPFSLSMLFSFDMLYGHVEKI